MISKLKYLIKGQRAIFRKFCRANDLQLDFQSNRKEFGILKSVFEAREYSDYFPFYKTSNIIDIGAHYGYFALFARNNSNKSSKIIAIEPGSNNFEHLKKNITDCKGDNIAILKYSIAGKSGSSKLYLGDTLNNSLVENYSLLGEKREFEETEVKTLEEIIIDNGLEKIDFIKIDCEGSEYSILENTPGYIYDRIITISLEFHDLKDQDFTGESLIKLLAEKGFEIVKFKYDRTTMNLNYGKIIGTKILNRSKNNNR